MSGMTSLTAEQINEIAMKAINAVRKDKEANRREGNLIRVRRLNDWDNAMNDLRLRLIRAIECGGIEQ